MNIKTELWQAVVKLKKANIKSAHLDAEILLSFILNKTREFILTLPELKLTKAQQSKFNKLISRRIKGEPIAYLIGEKEFYGNKFLVNKQALIPRPETELMVDEALKIIKTKPAKFTLIDIGTGSGCVIISLAKILGNKYKYFGTDISKTALNIARKNSKINKAQFIKFASGDLLQPLLNSKILNRKSKILILANLPYGWTAWLNNSSADTIGLKFEPKIALFMGKDGLELYEKLLIQLRDVEKINKNINAFLEIDPRQKLKIGRMIKKNLPDATFAIKKDLKGHNRLIILKLG